MWIVDTTLGFSRAPVNELNSALGLDGGNSTIAILWNNITAVDQTASHVLSMTGVALGHHTSRLKDGVGDLSDRELFSW